MKSLRAALPEGSYWWHQVLAGQEYPPPTSTPPRECRRLGDRGRIYPFYYVIFTALDSEPAGRLDPPTFERWVAVAGEVTGTKIGGDAKTDPRWRAAFDAGITPRDAVATIARDRRRRRRRGRACCLDCYNHIKLRRELERAIFEGRIVRDDGTGGLRQPPAEELGADGAPAEGTSPSAAGLERLRMEGLACPPGQGPVVEERPLPTDDMRVLAEQIQRWREGKKTTILDDDSRRPR